MKFLLLILLLPIYKSHTNKISENEVYCYIRSLGIKNPKIVLKQAIYETGHFKSKIFKSKNNLFGFRRSKSYLTFNSWQSCVVYYKNWQEKYYRDTTQDYYIFLQKKNYSGYKEFHYSNELKKIKIRASLICDSIEISMDTYEEK